MTFSQTGSARISPLLVATVASATIAGLLVLGSLTGVLPSKTRGEEPLRVDPQGQAGRVAGCALCGTIESVKVIEVYEEPGGANGATEPRTGAESAGAGPGGAIASGAMSVFDTLGNAMSARDAEKNVRKRHVYRVTVRMDDGSYRAISLSSPPVFAVGDKVRVVEGRLVGA